MEPMELLPRGRKRRRIDEGEPKRTAFGKILKKHHPDCGDTSSQGHFVRVEQFPDGLAIHTSTGKNKVSSYGGSKRARGNKPAHTHTSKGEVWWCGNTIRGKI